MSSTNTPLGNATLNAVTTAYMFLDVPIWQLFLFPIWKAELADSMSWAFTQGVSNLLCKMTNVPPSNETASTIGDDDDDKSNYEIKFQTKISQDTEKDVTEENGRNSLDGLKVMMDEKLLSLYNSSLLNIGCQIPKIVFDATFAGLSDSMSKSLISVAPAFGGESSQSDMSTSCVAIGLDFRSPQYCVIFVCVNEPSDSVSICNL